MLCEPNEKHGTFLLGEILFAGNMGSYDERLNDRHLLVPIRTRHSSQHAIADILSFRNALGSTFENKGVGVEKVE